jgi:hypothetical protein
VSDAARKRSSRIESCSSATVARRSPEDLVSDIQTPLEPQKTTSHRLMLAVVIFLGVLIVIAVCIMVAGLLLKFGDRPRPYVTDVGMFALPPDARILEMQSQPNRLILHLRTRAGDEVDIIDVSDGHVISRIKAPK